MKVQSVWVLNIIQHPRRRCPTPVSKSHSNFYFLPPACEILMRAINCPKSMEIILRFKYYLLRWHAGTDFWIKHTPFIGIDCYRLLLPNHIPAPTHSPIPAEPLLEFDAQPPHCEASPARRPPIIPASPAATSPMPYPSNAISGPGPAPSAPHHRNRCQVRIYAGPLPLQAAAHEGRDSRWVQSLTSR